MKNVKFTTGEFLPLEQHKVKIIQKLNLRDVNERKIAMDNAGYNTFLLKNSDVFLDMLTDSGVNAMSDLQQASMLRADDSYAGSDTFYRLESTIKELFGDFLFLPAHQGRACEHIISKTLVKNESIVPMNYHFTTTKAHIMIQGGSIEEIPTNHAFNLESDFEFKGNMDIDKLNHIISINGSDKIPFIRMEAGTNLIGGQPFSLENLKKVSAIARKNNINLVLDASLLSDNLHFIKTREKSCINLSIKEILLKISNLCDVIYFSARKLGCARGGAILVKNKILFKEMQSLIPLYEGFLTYGGMSVKEMEAINVGLQEVLDEDNISQGPIFIEFMTKELQKNNIPVVLPSGGLGCHINASKFLPHIEQCKYPSGALATALYLISGIRGMERGTMSEQRNPDGSEPLASMELLRLALPRRVFTMSQILFACDRLKWLYANRDLIGGLEWEDEPTILRFFSGRLKPIGNWAETLVNKFKNDMGNY